jgi:hypothetical protein
MQPASRMGAIVAVAAFVSGLAACSDSTVQSPAVPGSVAPGPSSVASPSGSPASPSIAAASPSGVPSAGPSVAPSREAIANPAKVVAGRVYRPAIDRAGFTTAITNPYLPLVPGTVWRYTGGGERVVTAVTDDTKTIMGIETVVVRDRGYQDGALTEDTFDWFAQDAAGNVWYFGEDTAECANGRITSRHGAWQAGVHGAQPGVVMLAAPSVGAYYRQEFLKGEAEDVARVMKVGGTIKNGSRTYRHTVVTEDFTALEPGNVERKTYAPDVGLIESRYVKGGTGAERLVEVKTGVRASAMPSGKLCRA